MVCPHFLIPCSFFPLNTSCNIYSLLIRLGLWQGKTNLLQHGCVFICILTYVAGIILRLAVVNSVCSAAWIWLLVTSTGKWWNSMLLLVVKNAGKENVTELSIFLLIVLSGQTDIRQNMTTGYDLVGCMHLILTLSHPYCLQHFFNLIFLDGCCFLIQAVFSHFHFF